MQAALSRTTGSEFLSLISLGIDSVSLANFQRHLPKTRDFLLHNLSAIEFTGLNKVGRGTIENLIPMLSGCSFSEWEKLFLENQSEIKCQLIWNKFEKMGYRTVVSEDLYWFLAYQNLRRNQSGTLDVTYDNFPHIHAQSTGVNPNSKFGCFEHQFSIRVLTDRVVQVASKLQRKLYYHHVWSELTTHNVLEFAKYLDDPIQELLNELKVKKLLNNTLLILTSDHGIISSDYSRTPEGLIEARMPFLYVIVPDWFRRKFRVAMANLERNSKGLTTHHDIHETLKGILNLSSIEDNVIAHAKDSSPRNSGRGRGRSLFSKIPLNRTCEDAGVPEEYCICYAWEQLQVQKDLRIVKAVSYALTIMDYKLYRHNKCSRLDLWKILSGRVKKNTDGKAGMIEVTFQTIPGHGIFSAAFKINPNAPQGEEMKLVGEIERQNLYKEQSACLGEEAKYTGWIRSACYCQ